MSFDAEESSPEGAATLSPAPLFFPWPPAGESTIQSFVDTWKESTFHPSSFFASMPQEEPFGPSVLYFIILSIIVAAIRLFWGMVLSHPDLDTAAVPSTFAMMRGISPIVGFLLSPIIQIAGLFIGAAITQVMLLLLVPQRGSFGRTVRMYAFAYSPALFCVVPLIGPLVGAIWSFVLSIIGVREAHRTTTARAVAVVLLPTLLLLIAFTILLVIVVGGAIMMMK